jgi:hypothetical protein
VQVYRMDWHMKKFDLENNDDKDAHIVREKGKTILRKVAVDSATESILGNKDTQEQESNCVYDLFQVAESGEINKNWCLTCPVTFCSTI